MPLGTSDQYFAVKSLPGKGWALVEKDRPMAVLMSFASFGSAFHEMERWETDRDARIAAERDRQNRDDR